MPFTEIEYTVKRHEDYWSVSRYLISEDENFAELEHADGFVEEVVYGLKLHLRERILKPQETIKLVKEVPFYLNLVKLQLNKLSVYSSDEQVVAELRKLNSPLCFDVAFFKDYKSYFWHEFYYDGENRYGEIGKNNEGFGDGDRTKTTRMREGFVYAFDEQEALKYAFVVTKGKFQAVELSEGDCTHTNFIDDERICGRIERFFEEDKFYDSGIYYFITSPYPLSKDRLFGTDTNKIPKIKPRDGGARIQLSKYGLRKLNEENRTGVQVLNDARTCVTTSEAGSVDSNYHLKFKVFSGEDAGISILFPDPIKELKRRADIYQERYEAYHKWITDPIQTKKAFLHLSVSGMIEKDSGLKSFADKNRLKEWSDAYHEQKVVHIRKLYYGITSLIEWLESSELNECLFNYIDSSDEALDEAVKAYAHALIYLDQRKEGQEFYRKQFESDDSFLVRLFNLKDKGSDIYIDRALALQEDFEQTGEAVNAGFTGRKVGQGVLGLATEAAPAITKYLKVRAIKNLANKFANGLSKLAAKGWKVLSSVLPEKIVKPVNFLGGKTAKIFQLDTIESKVFKSFLEVVNLSLAIYIFCKDDNPDNQVKNTISLVGAMLDFSAESHWIVAVAYSHTMTKYSSSATTGIYTQVQGHLATKTFATKVVPGFQLVSGIIDCYLGVDGALDAYYNKGNWRLSAGYGVFAVGGAVAAIGASMVIWGGGVSVGSGGTLAEVGVPVMLAGCVIEAIGMGMTFWFENRDIKDWIKSSIFGKQPILEGASYLKSLEQQIQRLNEILCDFRVSVEFNELDNHPYHRTEVIFTIRPRLIIESAYIEFCDLRAIADDRWIEYLNPFSDSEDVSTGGEGSPKTILHLKDIINDPNKVQKNTDGTVKTIKQSFFYKMDIDRVFGSIDISFNNGTLQGRIKEFDEWANFTE